MKRYASEFVNKYNMRKVSEDTEMYFQKVIDSDTKTQYFSVHKLETCDECYFVHQVFYKNKFDVRRNRMGKMGCAKFIFGLADDIFSRHRYMEVELGE